MINGIRDIILLSVFTSHGSPVTGGVEALCCVSSETPSFPSYLFSSWFPYLVLVVNTNSKGNTLSGPQ